jgi:hypothetical protein
MAEEKSDPPGAVSDQNQEEQPSELREDGQHPEPRSRDEEHGGGGTGGDSSGASGEGSQSTGNPDSAG